MIGVVLVTHGRLAAEFVAALEHVVGAQTQIAAICIGPDDDMEERRQDILRSIAAVDTGDGAILLTDMFGGTPSNLAISVMDRARIEVIAGVNLPMLIKLASLRQAESLERTVLGAQEAGRKYINVASQLSAMHADERGPLSNCHGRHGFARAWRDGSPGSAISVGCTRAPPPGLLRPSGNSMPRCGCARTGPRSQVTKFWSCSYWRLRRAR